MEERNHLKDQLEETIRELNVLFGEMEGKMKEGVREAKEIFDREKQHFSTFLEDQKQQWQRFGLMDDIGFRKLLEKLEMLVNLLSAPDPVQADEFTAWRDQRVRIVFELEFLAREFFPEMNDREKELFTRLKTHLDQYRGKLTEIDFNTIPELLPFQRDLLQVAGEAVQLINEESVVDWKRLEGFKEEIAASFDHLKKAMGNLFTK